MAETLGDLQFPSLYERVSDHDMVVRASSISSLFQNNEEIRDKALFSQYDSDLLERTPETFKRLARFAYNFHARVSQSIFSQEEIEEVVQKLPFYRNTALVTLPYIFHDSEIQSGNSSLVIQDSSDTCEAVVAPLEILRELGMDSLQSIDTLRKRSWSADNVLALFERVNFGNLYKVDTLTLLHVSESSRLDVRPPEIEQMIAQIQSKITT